MTITQCDGSSKLHRSFYWGYPSLPDTTDAMEEVKDRATQSAWGAGGNSFLELHNTNFHKGIHAVYSKISA